MLDCSKPHDSGSRSGRLAVALTLLAAPFLALSDFLLFEKVFFYFDFEVQWVPFHQFAHAALSGGQSAIWNPYIMLGFPQHAESQLGIFYPVNMLLHWLSNQAYAIALSLYMHLVIAMVGTYFLARSCRLGAIAALHAAICFGLSGFMFAQFTNYNITLVAAYLPLKLLFITLYFERGRGVYLLYFALAFGVELLISHANTSFISGVASGLYFLALAVARRRFLPMVRDLAFYAACSVLAVMLAAVQILPTFEFFALSDRSAGISYEMATSYSHAFTHYLTAFFPMMHGVLSADYTGRGGFEENFFYIGTFGILLALFGAAMLMRRRDSRPLAALGGVGLFAFVLSLGSNIPFVDLYRWLFGLPGFGLFRCPARWSLVLTLALAVLSGYGLQALIGYMRARKTAAASLTIVAVALLAPPLALWFAWHEGIFNGWELLQKIAQPLASELHAERINRLLYGIFRQISPLTYFLLLLLALLCAVLASSRLPARYCAAAIVALGLLDMLCVVKPANPRAASDFYAAEVPHIEYLKRNAGVFRAVSPEDMPNSISLNNSMPAFYGVQGVRGYAALHLGNYLMLGDHLSNPEILDYVGVRYEIRRGDNETYEVHDRPDAFPRAFLLEFYRIEHDKQAAFDSFLNMSQQERRSTVALAADSAASLELFAPNPPPFEGDDWPELRPARITAYGHTRVEIQGETWQPAFLLLTDMYYPGWRARINGEPVPVVRLNGAFRGVYIREPGPFDLEFEFRPLSFVAGVWLSLFALLLWALLWRVAVLRSGAAPAQKPRPPGLRLPVQHVLSRARPRRPPYRNP